MNIIIICGLIGYIILWIYALCKFKECRIEYILGSIIGFMIGCYMFAALDNNPSALDVYRRNTTLEIKTVNGIPKDTVVVFKK